MCIAHCALFLALSPAVSAQSSATLEREAAKTLATGGREKAAPLYLKAAVGRAQEAKSLYAKDKNDLSLDEAVAFGEEAEIMAGANAAVAARERDAEAAHCLATAVDFDYGGWPAVADEWFARADAVDGVSDEVKGRIAKEKARIAKERDPTEYDPKPYVAPPRFAKRDALKEKINDAIAGKIHPQRLAALWSEYGYACFLCFHPDGMREARDAIAELKKKPSYYADWWLNAIKTYDAFKAFPKPEEEIVFPKDLAAMGVEDKLTAIAGELDWDPEDATDCIREAIESGATTIVLEDRGSPWYVQTIKPKSNQRIVLKKGVKILMDKVSAQQNSGAPMFDLSGAHNVIIEGEGGPEDVYVGKFASMAERNAKSKDYGGSGIHFSGSRNIVVRNITFGANTMDGVTLTGIGANTQEIFLENLVLRDNYRQAMSACNIFGLYCRNVSFLNTFGGEPMCGIDFESAYENEATSEMYFLDCTFADNAGAAVMFSQSSYYPVTALFRRCRFLPGRNHQQITVFARCGVYMGQNAKAPSRIVFDDCDMETPVWTAPFILSNSSLFDVSFRNFRLKEKNRGERSSAVNSPIKIDLRREYRFSFNWKDWDVANEGSLTFDNFTVEGFDDLPPLTLWDFTGGYDVPNVSGTLVMNGKTVDMSAYAYKAPEKAMGLREIRKFDPADYVPPDKDAKAETPASIPVSFGFTWSGSWFDTGCEYRAIYAEDGEWKVKKILPGVTQLGLKGRPVAYYCRSVESRAKLVPRNPKEPCTLYFEVPPGGAECVVRFALGEGTLRNPAGEVVREITWKKPREHRYLKIKPASDKAEIWSLTLKGDATIKFFDPLSGIFAESPEALPRRRP